MTAAYFIYQMRGRSTQHVKIHEKNDDVVAHPRSLTMSHHFSHFLSLPHMAYFYYFQLQSTKIIVHYYVAASSGKGNIGVEMLLAAAASVLLGFGSLFLMATFDLYV